MIKAVGESFPSRLLSTAESVPPDDLSREERIRREQENTERCIEDMLGGPNRDAQEDERRSKRGKMAGRERVKRLRRRLRGA